MRILLVGEYSGFHNSLKHGLTALGHEVTIVASGDGFKNYPADVSLRSSAFDSWFMQKVKVGVWKLTGVDLVSWWMWARFLAISEKLVLSLSKGKSVKKLPPHDIVQFINSNPLNCTPKIERRFLKLFLNCAPKAILVACGDDAEYVKYLKNDHTGYSIFDVLQTTADNYKLSGSLKYLQEGYRENYDFLVQKCAHVIPSNTDYAMALQNQKKATPIIKAPVVIDKFPLTQNSDLSVIQIFMGINRSNYWKKGINYFELALEQIKAKYGDLVKITIAEDLPYAKYIQQYDSCHILLDQVLCYDQGYNALEAMLKGKVVFAGGGPEYFRYHEVDSVPVIDATPDVDDLVKKLSDLIENPASILELGKQARDYVIAHHDSIQIAEEYLKYYDG
jgi:glycosyltransferase involved in cell wall biosynthesis